MTRIADRLSDAASDRGVTPLIGIVLLFGIVGAGVILVALTGPVALDAVEAQAADERSVRTMDVVRSGVEDAQYGQRERFDGVWATEELGRMTIELNGRVDETRPMGAFLHESAGGRYASQLGGTWTETESGSRLIREPRLEYETHTRGDTEIRKLSVPPIEIDEVEETTEGDDVIAGYRPADEPIGEALIERLDDDEPLRNVTITIEDSPYAAAWARYLEDELPTHRADSEVQLRDGAVVATAPLGAEPSTSDDAERADPPGAIEGPDQPFDARVTLAGADFGWSPQVGPFADAIDVFDLFGPGEWDSFDVDAPEAAFERVEDPDGDLEYFQTVNGTIEPTEPHEELTFEATEYDEFRIAVTADEDFSVELREDGEVMEDTGFIFSGDARWTADAGETIDESYQVYRSDTSFDGGEATIRIAGREGDEPVDYELTLEQTRVDSSILDVAGDPAWFQRFPIETELQFENDSGTTTVQPWPETDVDAVSDPAAAHPNDVNHPAVDYPLTYEAESLEPGTTFAPTVAWRDGFCGSMNSYAGTWRRPDAGVYEDEVLFEMGCAAENDDGFDLLELLEPLDVFDWFGDDDDPTALNRELNGLEHVNGGDGDDASDLAGERVKVLEDGDRVPAVEPFEAQRNLTQLLGPDVVVESDGHHEVDLDPGEYVVLFELAPESYMDLENRNADETLWEYALRTGSDAPDFNDMAMVFEITEVHDGPRSGDSSRDRAGALDVADGVITAEAG